ncbi:MAG: hypothetical protein IT585_09730 [candidate division Zixibacteria bacterium]|nr:hypothetical protein [candidate division Zixibacteria bacterium]
MKNASIDQKLLAILVAIQNLLPDYIEKVREEYFKETSSVFILRAIKKAYVDGVTFDSGSCPHYLQTPVDTTWLWECENESPKLIDTYIKILRDSYVRREAKEAARQFATMADDKNTKIDYVISQHATKLQELMRSDSRSRPVPFGEAMKATMESIKNHFAQRMSGKLIGVSLGTTELNKMTGGVRPGELFVVAGRPGMGKTAFGLRIIEDNSMAKNERGLVFSMEMSAESLYERLISSRVGISLNNLHTGFVAKAELERMYEPVSCRDCHGTNTVSKTTYQEYRVENACTDCGSTNIMTMFDAVLSTEYPIHIVDTAGLSVHQIISIIKGHKLQHEDLKYVVIDYLNIIGRNVSGSNLNEKYDNICTMLRDAAKNIGVAIVLFAQLSRSVEGETDKRPSLRHLRDSGAIEQIADTVLLLFRESYYDKTNTNALVDLEIDIAKQRNGPTGRTITTMDLVTQKIYEERVENILASSPRRRKKTKLTRLNPHYTLVSKRAAGSCLKPSCYRVITYRDLYTRETLRLSPCVDPAAYILKGKWMFHCCCPVIESNGTEAGITSAISQGCLDQVWLSYAIESEGRGHYE